MARAYVHSGQIWAARRQWSPGVGLSPPRRPLLAPVSCAGRSARLNAMVDNGISLRSLHRPLVVLTGAMAVLCVVALAGLLVDGRMIVNAPIWFKPFKF